MAFSCQGEDAEPVGVKGTKIRRKQAIAYMGRVLGAGVQAQHFRQGIRIGIKIG